MIEHWFPTLIYSDRLVEFKIHNQYLTEKAYSIRKMANNKISTNWKCDTYNTLGQYDYIKDNDKIVLSLIDVCKNHVEVFADEFGVDKSHNLKCKDFWFNISSSGNFQEDHQHPKSHFSLVYYVKVPDKNCGNICFTSIEYMVSEMFPLPKKHDTFASCKKCEYIPIESSLLIFRSGLIHSVGKNTSSEDRISISMNFEYE